LVQDITVQLVGMQPGTASAAAQPAKTIVVSDHGALIECRSSFRSGAEVMIHNPKNLQNAVFKVLRSTPSTAGSLWKVAVEFAEPEAGDFWGLR